MDNVDYSNTIGALDALRQEQQRKAEKGVRVNPTANPASIKGRMTIKDPVAAKQAGQLVTLKNHALKVRNTLAALHDEIKSKYAAGEDVDEKTIDKAVMLRRKLDYFAEMGNELVTGQKTWDIPANMFLETDERFPEIPENQSPKI